MRKKIVFTIISLLLFSSLAAFAQSSTLDERTERKLENYFLNYHLSAHARAKQARMIKYDIDNTSRILTIHANETFARQDFDEKLVKKIYKKIRKELPVPYNDYRIKVVTNGLTIDQLVVSQPPIDTPVRQAWGQIEYTGAPWVQNTDKPHQISQGLQNRHLVVYASHGRYYDQDKGCWKWQRPHLFGTTEDLFTQTIIVPYLIPMLENAGAIVYTPRERDWQTNEIIVDNDGVQAGSSYEEFTPSGSWKTTPSRGFRFHYGAYLDNENPFEAGSARQIKATKKSSKTSFISYKPNFPEDGKYAVYVSYQTLPKSVDDAEYIVYHQGQETHFRVNQQMGGGTWVYLGTFEFDKGFSDLNRVILTNHSSGKGVVTADAVRFGGGMGNIQRGGCTSGLPRALEGARYLAQWSGAPYSVYASKGGRNDYGDDINTRPYMTNWLAGGSVYVPAIEGLRVPIDLSLALHSDAGFIPNGKDLVGSLAICTTDFNDGKLNTGISRQASKALALALLENLTKDIEYQFGKWPKRYLWDKNYSETRNPEVPSAILEMLSHQSFPDMRKAQDPNFKFTLARSIYKTLLKFEAVQHGTGYVVQPLQPTNFSVEFVKGAPNKVRLSWDSQLDPQEENARPTSYNIYTASGEEGFNNGFNIKATSCEVQLRPDRQYNFKVTAVNAGGESFPTEVLSAVYHPEATQTILVVNGFHRLSAPSVIDNDTLQGFDLDRDLGVSYGLTAGWNGRQTDFKRSKMGIEGPGGLGYGGSELAGLFIAGNDFNYVAAHVEAIASGRKYNIVSCSSKAIESGKVRLEPYPCIDLIVGLEKYSPTALFSYKTFSTQMQTVLRAYAANGGRLLVSGSYLGSDMQATHEQDFLDNVLNVRYAATESLTKESQIKGMGTSFDIYRQFNKYHYSATHPEVLNPVGAAFCAMQYADGSSAAVACENGRKRTFVMGFPFECIQSKEQKKLIMQGIMNFLMK